jgi:nitrilase
MKPVKVAVVQATPVLFNLEATIEKIEQLLLEAAQNGAELVLFPEAFIPAYPRGLGFGTVVGSRSEEGRALWLKYWSNSLDVESEQMQSIQKAVQKAGVYMSLGITEREENSGTLYCSLLYFAPDGTLLGKHRKLKPTGTERLIWGEGDGSTLNVYDTKIGKIGGLICWENYMPLARLALYEQGVEIYLAPTADQRDGWLATLRHIALEGRCFVLGCNQFVQKSDYPKALQEEIKDQAEILCRGGSVVISPLGEILAGPLWDKPGILYADLNKEDLVKAKMDFDVFGHYHRPDVFEFNYRKGKNID